MTRDATTAFARTLVDELVRGGVRHAVVSPGSRSAPLALAIAGDDRLALHVVLDERTAGFVAVGIGRATGLPALVVTTSGTAAANLHPAVLEAHHGEVPIIVATADRPPELRGVGAPQTIDQMGLYGDAVRGAVDAEVPADVPDAAGRWRDLAARTVLAATGVRPGPVHLNLPFREPLIPTGAPLVDAPGRPDGAPWVVRSEPERTPDPAAVTALADRVRSHPSGFLVLGAGARVRPESVATFSSASGWPVLAEPTVAIGTVPAVDAIEALLRDEVVAADAPTTWLRVGGIPTIRVVFEWLDRTTGVLVDASGVIRDPAGTVDQIVAADPDAVLTAVATALADHAPDHDWTLRWTARDAAARAAIDDCLDAGTERAEPRVARDVVQSVPGGGSLLVASSMPIRDVATFARRRPDVVVHSNRGVNGIDGFAGTALGIALATESPTVALTGDLGFLHDLGGLVASAGRAVDLALVVIDNAGGGIFSFLPQAALPDHFETLFGTPPAVDVGAVAAGFGFAVYEVASADGVRPAVANALEAGGVHVVRVRTDRVRNVADHRAVWAAVAGALSAG